jgi:hypothetical protein
MEQTEVVVLQACIQIFLQSYGKRSRIQGTTLEVNMLAIKHILRAVSSDKRLDYASLDRRHRSFKAA